MLARNGARIIRKCNGLRSYSKSLPKGVPFDIHPEVENALQEGKPVVALESTIITHGMPYPTNLQTAQSVESIVRSTGSVPATIAILKGRITVGLTSEQLQKLADVENNPGAVKVSRRDLAPVVALKKDGGTTISGTMLVAALAGIKVFATGGLGGVHRGGEVSMDVSADLTELGRTPVAVVAAGAKSILDIGRTLEFLETQGVMVATYGKTHDFPAFFSPTSGHQSPWRVDNPLDAARIIYTSNALGLNAGQFFGVPIPAAYEAAGASIQAAVNQAVRESEENGISKRGKEATPWLLRRVTELTGGKSLESNVALIENTAKIGGQIAVELSRLSEKSEDRSQVYRGVDLKVSSTSQPAIEDTNRPITQNASEQPKPKLVVIGASAIDITAQAQASSQSATHSTSPGSVTVTLGGVARNMAEAAHRSSGSRHETLLVSPVGDDAFATLLHQEMKAMGMRGDGLLHPTKLSGTNAVSRRTPVCNLVLDGEGSLVGGVADFEAMGTLNVNEVLSHIDPQNTRLVAIDGNVSPDLLTGIIDHNNRNGILTWFEPTSLPKCGNIFAAVRKEFEASPFPLPSSPIAYASPNTLELTRMYEMARNEELMSSSRWWKTIDAFGLDSSYQTQLARLAQLPVHHKSDGSEALSFLVQDGIAQMAVNLLPFFQHLVVKCGHRGVFLAFHAQSADSGSWQTDIAQRRQIAVTTRTGQLLVIKHFPPITISATEIVSTTGAGDSLVGTLLSNTHMSNGQTFKSPEMAERAMKHAQIAAVASLRSSKSVSTEILPMMSLE